MTDVTSQYIYYLIAGGFLVGAIIIILNLPKLITPLKPSKVIHLVLLTVLIVAGGWMRIYRVPHEFRVFYNEYDLYNSARMIEEHQDIRWCKAGTFAECEEMESPMKFSGFPFLWALAMKISGEKGPETGFYLNSVLGTVSILVIYLLAMAATRSPVVSNRNCVFIISSTIVAIASILIILIRIFCSKNLLEPV